MLAAEHLAPAIARRTIADYLHAQGYDAATAHAVELAVSEAVSNVVVHAYEDRDVPGDVRILVDAGAEFVDVVVADSGVGMAPREDSPGLGIGMALIRRLSDSVEERRTPGGGTELHMHFRVRAR